MVSGSDTVLFNASVGSRYGESGCYCLKTASCAEPVVDVIRQWAWMCQELSLWLVHDADVGFKKRLACLVNCAPIKVVCDELVAIHTPHEGTVTHTKNSFAKAVEQSSS